MAERKSLSGLYKDKQRTLVLDGAMGSQLAERGCSQDKNLWSSICNITHPEIVEQLHNDYISAGADIITTNTFRTNPAAAKDFLPCVSLKDFVSRSVALAINAVEDKNVLIAGSNAPAEDCYKYERNLTRNELECNHSTHIELLWEAGCDIIWNETHGHLDEIEIIGEFCSRNKIPFAMNIYFENGMILSGETLGEAVKTVAGYNPDAIGFNCVSPAEFENSSGVLKAFKNFGFYLNCGAGDVRDSHIFCGISPSDYVIEIKKYSAMKPLFIGSCCGSSPAHTSEIKKYLDGISGN